MNEVLVLQGPNLDLLGQREPEIYGHTTLVEIQAHLDTVAATLGWRLRHVQSAHEGVLVEAVHAAWRDGCVGAIVNAAAYTHTSVALLLTSASVSSQSSAVLDTPGPSQSPASTVTGVATPGVSSSASRVWMISGRAR